MIFEINPGKWFQRKAGAAKAAPVAAAVPAIPVEAVGLFAEGGLAQGGTVFHVDARGCDPDLVSAVVKRALLTHGQTISRLQKISTSAKAVENVMANKFVSVMEAIGRGFEKGLTWAVKYAIPVEKLIAMIFPPAAPVAIELADATQLIQNAVLMVEQKYAASGVQAGTGAQKSAEVLALTEQAVTGLLTKAGVSTVSTDYIQSIIDAVVAILNVQTFTDTVPVPAAPAAVKAAA